MPPKKRGLDVIDLISSEGENSSAPPPSKRPAVNRGPSSGQSTGARVAGSQPYNTQRTASSSSFAGPSSQHVYYDRDDADLIDLTQAPDGPARELYGNLGMDSGPYLGYYVI